MESQPEITEPSKEPSIVQERLNWKLACRDDGKIAQGLYAGEEIEEMHELSDAGLLDEFFVFLEEVGLMQAFEQMNVPGAKRMLVPTVQLVLLYLLKVLCGGSSMNELPRVLFSDLGLMELVGFNAQQCADGLRHSRGCAAQNETEARATHCPVSGRQHQQTRRGGDGATVEPDGAVARPAGHVYRQARGRPGWKQTAHPAEL
jgi:hypothetical protein